LPHRRDPTKLRASELADKLARLVYRQTIDFPRAERFGLHLQLRGTAISMASNIVEACVRHSLADCLRSPDIALGSVEEPEYQISLAHHPGRLVDAAELSSLVVKVVKILDGSTGSLHKSPDESD
jgi:four helix bundle protein